MVNTQLPRPFLRGEVARRPATRRKSWRGGGEGFSRRAGETPHPRSARPLPLKRGEVSSVKVFLLAFWCSFVSCATALAGSPPKLIVIVVGDQIRADYLERYHDALEPGGLRRFRDQGMYFTHALMDHAVTKTSPGHVLIGSGVSPAQSGIVGNDWYDASLGHAVSAAELVPGGRRVQLRWFVGSSLAQRIHASRPQSRVISLSLKDRGALLLTGPDQDGAYWWDSDKQDFVNYSSIPPPWLVQFNRQIRSFARQHKKWNALTGVTSKQARDFAETAKLTKGHIKDRWGLGRKFPHPVPSIKALMNSPFSDDIVEQLAETAVREWHLGQNPSGDPDVLTVSFSAVDLVGHEYGPDSREVMDAFLRLDRAVGKLIRSLEQQVGPDIIWVFSSDHGVTSFPEVSRARGLPAGRVRFNKAAISPEGLVEAVSPPFIYMNEAVLRGQPQKRAQAVAQVRDGLQRMEGVDKVYTVIDVEGRQAPRVILRSFYLPKAGEVKRCGDLMVILKPYYIFSEDDYGTTHGQPTPDDQRVPLGFYGSGIKRSLHEEPVSPAMVAPTLLKLLDIPASDLAAPAAIF